MKERTGASVPWLAIVAMAWAPSAWAQEGDDEWPDDLPEATGETEAAPADEAPAGDVAAGPVDELEMSDEERAAAAAAAEEAAASEPLPEIGEDQLQVFKLERGFYFSSDMGIFMTFGGTRGYSNVQPYMTLKAGFDINDNLGVQLSVAHGYASGNPISANDRPGFGGNETANYSMLNFGAEVVGAIRPTDRFAIELKGGAGGTHINPQLTDPADVNATISPMGLHFVGGLDLKYLTLLTDFTAGISFTGYYVAPGFNFNAAIVALGSAFVVRYTF